MARLLALVLCCLLRCALGGFATASACWHMYRNQWRREFGVLIAHGFVPWTVPSAAAGASFRLVALFATCKAAEAGTLMINPGLCFADGTSLLVRQGNGSARVPVESVLPGQLVRTLSGGLPVWTPVLANKRLAGPVASVRISALSGGLVRNLTVTAEHVMPRCSGAARFDGCLPALAGELDVGDVVVIASDGVESMAGVVGIEDLTLQARNVLHTADGTVLADGFLTTTVCDGVADMAGDADMSSFLEHWRGQHVALLA